MNTFFNVYSEELGKAVREHPDEYRYDTSEVPGVVEKMRAAVASDGAWNKDSRAFRNTCKRLGIKHTYIAIKHFIANHE